MKHNLKFLHFVFILLFSCFFSLEDSYAQKYSDLPLDKKEYLMEQFNIEQFKQHKKGSDWQFTLPDGTEILQTESKKSYLERIRPINSPYTYYKEFNLQGKLTVKSVEFYNTFVGERVYFDPNTGRVIRKEDYDKDFKFSIDDLASKMQKEFQFNIMDKKETFLVSRILDTKRMPKAYYEVYQKKDKMSHNIYLIEGNTGDLVYSMTLPREGNRRRIYDEYLKSLPH